jgi:enoyl-CoA hydratase
MAYANLLTEVRNNAFIITINRPDKLNALNMETIAEIGKAVSEGAAMNSVAGIIITGSGNKAFVAGADISEFTAYSNSEAKKLSKHGHDVFNSIENCSKPVIAAVNGFALGGGCELAMSCHFRIASDNAKFGQPEVKLGLIPGYGGTQRFPMLIGKGKAIELMLTGDMLNAADALTLGLINYITTPEQLIDKCVDIVSRIALQAPLAVDSIIQCVNAYYSNEDGYAKEIDNFSRCFATEDFKEGTDAFMNKRKPEFKGK